MLSAMKIAWDTLHLELLHEAEMKIIVDHISNKLNWSLHRVMRILCHFFVHQVMDDLVHLLVHLNPQVMDDLVHLLGLNLDMLVKNVLNQDQDTNVRTQDFLERAVMSFAVRASVLPQQDSQDQVVKHKICPDPPVVPDDPLVDQVRLV
jgi:hypothetical protein